LGVAGAIAALAAFSSVLPGKLLPVPQDFAPLAKPQAPKPGDARPEKAYRARSRGCKS